MGVWVVQGDAHSTISTDLDASGVRSLARGLVSLERAAEILVVSLTMNPARDKDTNTPALGVSNRRGQRSASFPGTQQLSLAPGGFLATKDTWHRLRVQGWSLLQHQLAPPRGGMSAAAANPALCRAARRFARQRLGARGCFGKGTSAVSHPDLTSWRLRSWPGNRACSLAGKRWARATTD